MKRGFALFFLFVILLNIAGYYLLMEGWKWHVSVSWSDAENQKENQEMIVRIPITVPYNTQNGEWQSAEGQFEYLGEVYRITKQKVDLDAVLLACVKDAESKLINQHLEEFVKSFTDKPSDGKQQTRVFPGFIKEYISQHILLTSGHNGWYQQRSLSTLVDQLASTFEFSILLPPEAV